MHCTCGTWIVVIRNVLIVCYKRYHVCVSQWHILTETLTVRSAAPRYFWVSINLLEPLQQCAHFVSELTEGTGYHLWNIHIIWCQKRRAFFVLIARVGRGPPETLQVFFATDHRRRDSSLQQNQRRQACRGILDLHSALKARPRFKAVSRDNEMKTLVEKQK